MKLLSATLLLALMTAVSPRLVETQLPERPREKPGARREGFDRRRGESQGPQREALERRVGERIAMMVKQRLDLSDDQVQKLSGVNRKFEERRRVLHEQERDVRMSLRDEVMTGDRANQSKVAELLERMLKVQRQRIDLVEEEQRDLSAFLTPVQRAKYLGLQDQMRKRLEQMRLKRQRGGGPGFRQPKQP